MTNRKLAVLGTPAYVAAEAAANPGYVIRHGDWHGAALGIVPAKATDGSVQFTRFCRKRGIPLYAGNVRTCVEQAVKELGEREAIRSRIEGPKATTQYDIVAVAEKWSTGSGGGVYSIYNLLRELHMLGYKVITANASNILNGEVVGKVYLTTGPLYRNKSVQRVMREVEGYKVLHIDRAMEEKDYRLDYSEYDAVTANSTYTAELAYSNGGHPVYIQEPILSPVLAKIQGRRKKQYVLQLNLFDRRGGKTFFDVAALMPKQQFAAVDWAKKALKPESYDNITNLPWTAQTWRHFKDASVLLLPNTSQVPETYGRVVAEAIANGIPVVCSDGGYMPEWKKRYPKHVYLVKEDSPAEDYAAAVKKALKARVKKQPELWEPNIDGWKHLLAVAGIKPGTNNSYEIHSCAGLGDGVYLFRLIDTMVKKELGDIYLSAGSKQRLSGKVLQMHHAIKDGAVPPNAIRLVLGPADLRDKLRFVQTEPRMESFARRSFVTVDNSKPVTYSFDGVDTDAVDAMLPEGPCVGVSLCGSPEYKMKTMEYGRQKEVIEALKAYGKYTVVLIGIDTTLQIDGVCDLRGKTTLEQAVYAVSKMDRFIAVDSGLCHTACSLHIPTVAIYGPVGDDCHIQFTEWGGKVAEVCLHLDCQPCWMNNGKKGTDSYVCQDSPPCLNVEPSTIVKALASLGRKKR